MANTCDRRTYRYLADRGRQTHHCCDYHTCRNSEEAGLRDRLLDLPDNHERSAGKAGKDLQVPEGVGQEETRVQYQAEEVGTSH